MTLDMIFAQMVPPGGPPDQNEITTSIIHYHVDIPLSNSSHWYHVLTIFSIQQIIWVHNYTYDVSQRFTFYLGWCLCRSKFDEHACCRIPWPVPADTNNLTRVFISKLHEAHEVLGKSRIFVDYDIFLALILVLQQCWTYFLLRGCRRLQSHMA